jgi:hypothetical protein
MPSRASLLPTTKRQERHRRIPAIPNAKVTALGLTRLYIVPKLSILLYLSTSLPSSAARLLPSYFTQVGPEILTCLSLSECSGLSESVGIPTLNHCTASLLAVTRTHNDRTALGFSAISTSDLSLGRINLPETLGSRMQHDKHHFDFHKYGTRCGLI